jgi:hypothetical protein
MTGDSAQIERRRPPRRQPPGPAARRFGFAVAAFVDLLLLFLGNIWPGWQVLPFLTGATVQVLPWINASLAVGVVANVANLIFDRAWLKAFGDLVTTSVGLAAMIQLWVVFPFDFGESTFPWVVIVRTLIVIAIAGSAIGIVVAAVTFVRALLRRADD